MKFFKIIPDEYNMFINKLSIKSMFIFYFHLTPLIVILWTDTISALNETNVVFIFNKKYFDGYYVIF